jgi:hypothetical protein
MEGQRTVHAGNSKSVVKSMGDRHFVSVALSKIHAGSMRRIERIFATDVT